MATKTTDQPEVPRAGASGVKYGPAPKEDAPYEKQPVNQQYFAQPQAAPVQYVVMAESLKGVKGWLMFFVVCFALTSLSCVTMFFNAATNLNHYGSILDLLAMPFLTVLSISTVVFINLQKKLGKWLAVATLGAGALYSVINAIIEFAGGKSEAANVPMLLSSIIVGLIIQGLLILYFFASRRVKETLVN